MNAFFAGILGRSIIEAELSRLLIAASAVWLAAAAASIALRRCSAALRHRVWSLSIAAVLALPAVVLILPEHRVGAIRIPRQFAFVQPAPVVPPEHSPARGTGVDFTGREMLSGPAASAEPRPLAEDHVAIEQSGTASPSGFSTRIAATATHPASTSIGLAVNWPTLLCIAWIALTIWLMLRQAMSLLSARALLRRASRVVNARAIVAFKRISARLDVRARVQLLESPELGTPVCLGVLRPSILLPPGWERWPAEQFEAVLTHELAHVARRDVLWQTFARLACALYWPHPLAWISAWRMRVERELACDDWVLNAGESSTRYARWLLDFATVLPAKPHAAERIGVAMACRGGFDKRVSAILDARRARGLLSRRLTIVLTSLAIGLLGIAGTFSPLAPDSASARPGTSLSPIAAIAPLTRPAAPAGEFVEISGRAVDERGEPLAGVKVIGQLADRAYAAPTTADGTFSLYAEANPHNTGASIVLVAANADGGRQAFLELPGGDRRPDRFANIELVLRPARAFEVAVVDGKGAPVAGATVLADASYSLAGRCETDRAGKATLRVPPDAPLMFVLAQKPDVGLDYFLLWRKGAPHTNPYELEGDFSGPLKFVLNGAVAVKVHVIDEDDQPLAGVKVYAWLFEKLRKGGDANVSGLLLPQFIETTDAAGTALFRAVPADLSQHLTFWTMLPGHSSPDRWNYDPKSGKTDVTAKLLRQIRVSGRVTGADGAAAVGATVRAVGNNHSNFGDFRTETKTAADGSFTMEVDREKYYALIAQRGNQVSQIVHETILKKPVGPIELKLSDAAHISGQVTAGPDRAPLANVDVSFDRQDDSYGRLPPEQQLPGNVAGSNAIFTVLGWWAKADGEGRFDAYVPPGDYDARVYADAINLRRDIKVANAPLHVDLHSDEAMRGPNLLTGRIVPKDHPEQGVSEAAISGTGVGLDTMIHDATSDKQGNFVAQRGKDDLYLHAESPDRKLMGTIRVKAGEQNVVLPIGQTGSAHGRLVDPRGQALPGRQIDYGFRITSSNGTFVWAFGGQVKTDAVGDFAVNGLVPGFDYELNVVTSFRTDGQSTSWHTVGKARVEKPSSAALGDLTLPDEAQARTWRDYQAAAFKQPGSLRDRLDDAQETARLSYQNVLVVLGSPGEAACDQLFEHRYEDFNQHEVAAALSEYALAVFNKHGAPPELRNWATQMQIQWPDKGMTLAVLDIDGHLLGQTTGSALSDEGVLSRAKLIDFAKKYVLAKPDAQMLLDDALAQAGRDNKLVLLDESAPYCPWCIKLSKYIEANHTLLNKGFVCLTLDRRFAHGAEILARLHPKDFSTPWIAILAPDGKILAASDSQGENIGYPNDPQGIRQWEQMLRIATPRLGEADVRRLVNALVVK